MPFELPNLHASLFSKEIEDAQKKIDETKDALINIGVQSSIKQAKSDIILLAYEYINDKRVLPYEVERSWLDGHTYSPLTVQHIRDAAERKTGNLFFPDGYYLPLAKVVSVSNGNPSLTANTGAETYMLPTLNQSIDLLKNGRSSAQPSVQLVTAYTPGDSLITVDYNTSTGPLLISNGSISALVNANSIYFDGSYYKISITELVPPNGTLIGGSTVAANFSGYSNSQRQSLIGPNQNVLTGLTTKISTFSTNWQSAITNQLSQLSINTDADNEAQIDAAKTNTSSAQTLISTWLSLSNTGVNGKFIDINLNPLNSLVSTRISYVGSRTAEIVAALGNVTQNAFGLYSGNGLYKTRFQCVNFLVNSANGPLYEKFNLESTVDLFKSKVSNEVEKISFFKDVFKL